MKIVFSFLVFFLAAFSVYSGGIGEVQLVNEQTIPLDNISDIDIFYRSEGITLLTGDTNSLVIKEYMSRDDSSYYANITSSGNKLTIRRGNRPLSSGFFNQLRVRVEVYIPRHPLLGFSVETSSGRISTPFDERLSSPVSDRRLVQGTVGEGSPGNSINIRTSSGSISVNWRR